MACAPQPDSGGVIALESAITDGKSYDGHPSVGYLKMVKGTTAQLCTATLVGKRTVLTAAHCIVPGTTTTFHIKAGVYNVESSIAHSGWDEQSLANDIAVVRLSGAPPVTPSLIARQPVATGLKLTLVGFGSTAEGLQDAFVKRIAQNSVKEVWLTSFSVAGSGGAIGNTCQGDSGGPAFAEQGGREVQVGVTSAGVVPCGTLGFDTRVDAYQSWLASTAGGDLYDGTATDVEKPKVAIGSPADGARVAGQLTVTATASDNVGVEHVELLVDGKSSGTSTSAPYQFVVTLGAGKHSLRAAARDRQGNVGESETVSVEVEGGAAQGPPPPQSGGFGAVCSSSADCQSGLCGVDVATGERFCTARCDPATTACPQGARCVSAGAVSVCTMPPAGAKLEGTLEGGCQIAPAAGGLDAAWLLAAVALGLSSWRRGRSRRRGSRRRRRPARRAAAAAAPACR